MNKLKIKKIIKKIILFMNKLTLNYRKWQLIDWQQALDRSSVHSTVNDTLQQLDRQQCSSSMLLDTVPLSPTMNRYQTHSIGSTTALSD